MDTPRLISIIASLFLTSTARSPIFSAYWNSLKLPSSLTSQVIPTNANTVSLSKAQMSKFESALDALSKQARVAFVVEDAPLHPVLDASSSINAIENLPLSEAVTRISKAYDYSFERKGRVFRLKKRYTDRHDLPCLTIPECRACINDIVRIVTPYNPQFSSTGELAGTDPLIADFSASLTPEQAAKLKGGGLPISSLSPEQKQMAYRFALYFYIQSSEYTMDGVAAVLSRVEKSILTYQAFGSQSVFGIKGQNSLGTYHFIYFDASSLYDSSKITDPKPDDISLPDTHNSKQYLSLSEIVERLNRKASRSVQRDRYLVDPEVAEKSVTLIGDSYATPSEIMSAVSSVYGLRLRATRDETENTETFRISRPPLPRVESIMDVAGAIQSALPEPLVRAVMGVNREDASAGSTANTTVLNPKKPPKNAAFQEYIARQREFNAQIERRHDMEQRPHVLKAEVGRILEKVYKQQNPVATVGLPVQNLDRINRNRLGLALLSDLYATGGHDLLVEAPPYISHFDDVVLTGGPYTAKDGSSRYSMGLNVLDPKTGQMTNYAGIANMRYHMSPL